MTVPALSVQKQEDQPIKMFNDYSLKYANLYEDFRKQFDFADRNKPNSLPDALEAILSVFEKAVTSILVTNVNTSQYYRADYAFWDEVFKKYSKEKVYAILATYLGCKVEASVALGYTGYPISVTPKVATIIVRFPKVDSSVHNYFAKAFKESTSQRNAANSFSASMATGDSAQRLGLLEYANTHLFQNVSTALPEYELSFSLAGLDALPIIKSALASPKKSKWNLGFLSIGYEFFEKNLTPEETKDYALAIASHGSASLLELASKFFSNHPSQDFLPFLAKALKEAKTKTRPTLDEPRILEILQKYPNSIEASNILVSFILDSYQGNLQDNTFKCNYQEPAWMLTACNTLALMESVEGVTPLANYLCSLEKSNSTLSDAYETMNDYLESLEADSGVSRAFRIITKDINTPRSWEKAGDLLYCFATFGASARKAGNTAKLEEVVETLSKLSVILPSKSLRTRAKALHDTFKENIREENIREENIRETSV